ncbi:MAG TPA: archease [Anaeromyxobacter sp.]|nr:archease [Anaeromyxobacter sp.]
MLALPQPFEDLGHTADLAVRVHGASAEQAMERLALALAALLAGGGEVTADAEESLSVRGGPGLSGTAVALLREILFRFCTERRIPFAIEVVRADETGAEARVRTGPYDPARHAAGHDVKAVTWHRARLEREGNRWVGEVVVDV